MKETLELLSSDNEVHSRLPWHVASLHQTFIFLFHLYPPINSPPSLLLSPALWWSAFSFCEINPCLSCKQMVGVVLVLFSFTVILGSIHSVIHCRASLLRELSSVLLGIWATLSLGISWWTQLVCSSWWVRTVFSGTWEHRLPLWHTDFIFFGFIARRRTATSCSIFYI